MSKMSGHIEMLADPAALARHVAEWMTAAALAAKGAFPGVAFRRLDAEGALSRCWLPTRSSGVSRGRACSWYWGDERFVPYDHPDSNLPDDPRGDAVQGAGAAGRTFIPVPTDGTPDDAAARYERTLQAAYGATVLDPARPLFDITLLGLGPDGHTASLLPGEPVLEERKRWVAAVSHGRPEVRITMTYPVIDSSRQVAFLVTGKEKAPIFKTIRAGNSQVPAARVRPVGQLIWFVDRAAAGEG